MKRHPHFTSPVGAGPEAEQVLLTDSQDVKVARSNDNLLQDDFAAVNVKCQRSFKLD